MSFFTELRRRNVFKVGIAYAVTTWILLQLTDVVSGILELPEWAPKLILLILGVGFVPALILAWAFELTPQGIKLEKDVPVEQSTRKRTGRKLDYLIMILLGLSLAYFIWESRFEKRTAEFEQATQAAQQAAEAIVPVREVPPEQAEANRNSIAVLPFVNRSANPDDAYFTDGIHDDLLTQLAKIGAFSVISRTSVMEYRDTTKNLKQIARELDVANIMEGSVQRLGNRVRINVQLIDAATDEHLWAEIYDRELTTENLFDIQSEIARNIATALKAKLTDTELASVADVPTSNVAAYNLYLQARQLAFGQTLANYRSALDMLEEALRLDPQFKLAWIAVARAHLNIYWFNGGDPAERDLARQAIDRARALDPDFPELYMAEGFYWYWGHLDYERALYNLDKAIEQMPGNNEVWMWRAWASRRAGHWDQAVDSMHKALRLDPRMSFNWSELGATLTYLHRWEEAREAYTTGREVDPESFWLKSGMAGLLLHHDGDTQSAISLTTGAQFTGVPDDFDAFVEARLAGRRFDEALQAARSMSDDLEIRRQGILLREDQAARILLFMGRRDEAKTAADAAWFRLQGLREKLGDDYRIDQAEAYVSSIRGEAPEQIRGRVAKALASRPADAVEEFRSDYDFARIFAIAGTAGDSARQLEPLLGPPSDATVKRVELDPAFDGIRESPEFTALLERHR